MTPLRNDRGYLIGWWDEDANAIWTPALKPSDAHKYPAEYVPWIPMNKQNTHNKAHFARFAAVKEIIEGREMSKAARKKLLEGISG